MSWRAWPSIGKRGIKRMAKPKAGPHWITFNSKREPVKCHKTVKAIDKAKAEVANIPGYDIQEVGRERCPFCNPKPKQEGEQTPEWVTLHETPTAAARPGQCPECMGSRVGIYKLSILNHRMVRTCQDCGHKMDMTTLKTWEG